MNRVISRLKIPYAYGFCDSFLDNILYVSLPILVDHVNQTTLKYYIPGTLYCLSLWRAVEKCRAKEATVNMIVAVFKRIVYMELLVPQVIRELIDVDRC